MGTGDHFRSPEIKFEYVLNCCCCVSDNRKLNTDHVAKLITLQVEARLHVDVGGLKYTRILLICNHPLVDF